MNITDKILFVSFVNEMSDILIETVEEFLCSEGVSESDVREVEDLAMAVKGVKDSVGEYIESLYALINQDKSA